MEPLQFYYFPFACSLAAHVILEESGLDYERHLINIQGGQHRTTDYIKRNPKGAVPALLIGDELLTENQAIMTYVADRVPEKKLIPFVGTMARYRAHEWMNFCAASIHPYVRSVFRPAAYVGDNDQAEAIIKAQGQMNVAKACDIVESKLPETGWTLGENFSVVDAYLLIMYIWSNNERMGEVSRRPKWQALTQRVLDRPCVQKIIGIEKKDRPDIFLGEGLNN